MKKYLLLTILLFFPLFSKAQGPQSGTTSFNSGTVLPTHCVPLPSLTFYVITGGVSVPYYCSAVDTWSSLAGSCASTPCVLQNGTTATTQAANDNSTKVATTNYVSQAFANINYFSQAYWNIQPGLFSTSTMLGAVYFTTYTSTSGLSGMIARLSGPISCSVAPVINLMDLGASPTTAYGSATAFITLSTGTSDGVYIEQLGNVLVPSHYYGVAMSAGTCVTPPTIDVTVRATW